MSHPEKENCPICLEEIKEKNFSVTDCGHKFHTTCLITCIKTNNNCPLCRTQITEPINNNVLFCMNVQSDITSDVYEEIDVDTMFEDLGLEENINNNEAMFEIIDSIISSTLGHTELYLNEQNIQTHHIESEHIHHIENQDTRHPVLVEDLIDILN